jgi:hypothetical protein
LGAGVVEVVDGEHGGSVRGWGQGYSRWGGGGSGAGSGRDGGFGGPGTGPPILRLLSRADLTGLLRWRETHLRGGRFPHPFVASPKVAPSQYARHLGTTT